MGATLSDALTEYFYQWEAIGRGCYVFDQPVELEPVFVPFSWKDAKPATAIDSGMRDTFISKFITNTFGPKQAEPPQKDEVQYEPSAYPFTSTELLWVFAISFLPKDLSETRALHQLLVLLSQSHAPISFEVIGTSRSIRVQFVCRESDRDYLHSQVVAYFPGCVISQVNNSVLGIVAEDKYTYVSEFCLNEEFTRPLTSPIKFDVDTLAGVYGLMEHLKEGEQLSFQVLFHGVQNSWAESIQRSVTGSDGKSFFADAPEMLDLAKEKIASPLFAVVIRAIAQSPTEHVAGQLSERINGAIILGSQSQANSLAVITKPSSTLEQIIDDILYRRSRRTGMILNVSELSTFVHYPFAISSRKLEHVPQKSKQAPAIALGHPFKLGGNMHLGAKQDVTLNSTHRLKHMHVIGATGTGKSTFLLSCIVQDILMGNGLAVLDPHGDLIESILPYISKERIDDVIVIDPADIDYPVGFNVLTAHSEIEKEILASDLVAAFRRLSTSFGDQMHSVLANAILAFLESTKGGTLIDLRRFLIEKPYREEYLKTVTDPNIVYYWQKEYPLLKSSSIGPILTRLDSFLRPKVIRNMVAQKKSLDFADILDSQKILLIKLSQGLIGTENSYLLGTFLVSKIYQTAIARQAQAKGERKDFFLYVDEFQNFVTPSMSSILSGTRKYGLGCILAHQDMLQLQKQDGEIASAVISNAGTRVCFRLGDIDAKRFEDGFSFFEAQDLQNLGIGQAIVRIERPEFDFNISTGELKEGDANVKAIISASREKYATQKQEVEQELRQVQGGNIEDVIIPEIKPFPPKQEKQVPKEETQQPVIETKPLTEEQIAKTKDTFIRQKEVSQHRYTQTLIKKMAEARGYKAVIEEPTPDGKGLVDVSLERNDKRIACEVGVTTTKEWEIHNIEKCLAAGYDIVVAVPIDKKAAEAMQKQLNKKLEQHFHARVFVMEADMLFRYLDTEITKEASSEKRIKGYRVKVEYESLSDETIKQKRESITKVVNAGLNTRQK